MSFKLKIGKDVDTEVRRIAAEQVDRAIAEIEDSTRDRSIVVHSVRKRCRRIRALLRLARSGFADTGMYRTENVFYRDLARSLATTRDADVTVQTFDHMLDEYGSAINRPACEPIRHRIVALSPDTANNPHRVEQGLSEAATRLRVARQRIGSWELDSTHEGLRPGLNACYRDGRDAMRTARRSAADTAIHDWRKQAKYHREHLRLHEDAWPEIFKPWHGTVDALCETLDSERDLALLGTAVDKVAQESDRGVADTLRGLIAVRREALREQAWTLGTRLYSESPKSFAARVSACWQTAGN